VGQLRPVSDEVTTGARVEFYRGSPFEHADTAPTGTQAITFGQAVIIPGEGGVLTRAITVGPCVPQLLELDEESLSLEEAEWAMLYAEFAKEDRELARSGLAHYAEALRKEDEYRAG
jgi:hypothetical protein